jgi:hypothetical protein
MYCSHGSSKWSFPIFLRATMPQVQSPDTGQGSGCGRFRVYLETQCAVLESTADMQKRGQASHNTLHLMILMAAEMSLSGERL